MDPKSFSSTSREPDVESGISVLSEDKVQGWAARQSSDYGDSLLPRRVGVAGMIEGKGKKLIEFGTSCRKHARFVTRPHRRRHFYFLSRRCPKGSDGLETDLHEPLIKSIGHEV